MALQLLISILISYLATLSYASDPSPLQDFCVADSKSTVFVNGKTCKDPNTVTADDFYFSGINKPGNASVLPSGIITGNLLTVNSFPGLNTLGISPAQVEFAPNGALPPHTHPRASEFVVVIKGTLFVGFLGSDPANPAAQKNKLFAKTLNAGDVFLFPQGLIHFLINTGKTNAVMIAGFNSQNPGYITIGNALFGSNPLINPDVLAKALRVDRNVINLILGQFA